MCGVFAIRVSGVVTISHLNVVSGTVAIVVGAGILNAWNVDTLE